MKIMTIATPLRPAIKMPPVIKDNSIHVNDDKSSLGLVSTKRIFQQLNDNHEDTTKKKKKCFLTDQIRHLKSKSVAKMPTYYRKDSRLAIKVIETVEFTTD